MPLSALKITSHNSEERLVGEEVSEEKQETIGAALLLSHVMGTRRSAGASIRFTAQSA